MGLRPTRVLVPYPCLDAPGEDCWRIAGQFYEDGGNRCFQWVGGRDRYHQSPRPLPLILLGFLFERGCERLVHLETDAVKDLHSATARTIPLSRYIAHGVLLGGIGWRPGRAGMRSATTRYTELSLTCGFAHWSDCRGIVRPRRGRLPAKSVMVYIHEIDTFLAYLEQQDIDMPPLHVKKPETWTIQA